MKRTKEEAAMTRQAVLDSALSVISRKGYAQTTLEEVAKTAGVTRGAVYWHFKNKFEIFRAVLIDIYNKGLKRMTRIIDSDLPPLEKLRQLTVELFLLIADREQFGIMEEIELFRFEKKEELRSIYEYHQEKAQWIIGLIKNILSEGMKNGEFDPNMDIKVAVIAFISYIGGIKSSWISGLVDISIEENAEQLADVFINGIKNKNNNPQATENNA